MYSATFQGASVTAAAQDLFEITAPSDAAVIIHRVEITDESSETSEQCVVMLKRGSSGTTSGSGGSSVTPALLQSGDGAVGSVVEKLNTTQMSGGTITQLAARGFNWLNGFLYAPTPEERIVLSPGERMTVAIPAPTARTCSGEMVFEEIGG
jgi:hypothetical protein